MLEFWSVINCIFAHLTKKLSLGYFKLCFIKNIVKTGNAPPLQGFTKYLTGPELPLIDLDNCTIPDGNFTCETSLDNVVDVYYFDDADTFSCKDQVSQIVHNFKRDSDFI